jgi:hypothetical protein
MSVKQPYRLHGPKMQAPAWLPANAQDIDLAARLHSNGRCRSHRIRGMAARRIRQRCSRDSNSDRSCLAFVMSAFDPKRKSSSVFCCGAQSRLDYPPVLIRM